MQEARTLIGAPSCRPAMLSARARTAVAALAALPQVDAAHLGAIGFCLAGSIVLELTRDVAPLVTS